MRVRDPIKVYCFDLNWATFDDAAGLADTASTVASAAHDGAALDPQEYFDHHRAMGNNALFCRLVGYAWGQPPRLQPHPRFAHGLEVMREAFHEMDRLTPARP